MESSLIFLLCFIVITVIVLVKYLLRRRFPVVVSCWFCGEKTKVPFDNRNCWDCPNCEQYNGFDKDGNYNKPIPAQYDEGLNQPMRCQEDEFIGGHNILCERCSQNQLLKVKQLANFVPYKEKNYDEEVEAFQHRIEKVYRLCLPCEIKVQQELQIQDEALSRRLSHLDGSRSFMNISQAEETFLHASYIDRRINKFIMASIVFHTLSLVCSILIGTKEISLDGDQAWQKQLLFLHPVLLWLDINAEFLAVLGLMSGVTAKLCLGKYRLHIIDAVSCPVWLLVLLSQTGFLAFQETGSLYHISSLVLNCITSAVCLGISRRRRDKPNQSMIKMFLDNSVSDSMSSVSPYSSVSQVGARSRSPEQRSEVESRSQVSSTTDPEKRDTKFRPADSTDNSPGVISTRQPDSNMSTNVDDTLTELDAFSLGTPAMRRNDSGVFSTVSQGSYASNLSHQSVTENLHSRKLGKGRPLLSPATFTHASTPNKHRLTPVPQYGLFSSPSTDSTPASFQDRTASTIRSSAFTPTSLFSSERHSFTPERPSSPVITSFGAPPFSNVPLHTDGHSQFSNTLTGINSFKDIGNTSAVARDFHPIAKQRLVAKKACNMMEDSDSDDDSFSGLTSISKRCPVDSTTGPKVHSKEQVPWYRNPGFVGFILGGSVVTNVLLVYQMTGFNNTK